MFKKLSMLTLLAAVMTFAGCCKECDKKKCETKERGDKHREHKDHRTKEDNKKQSAATCTMCGMSIKNCVCMKK